MCGRSGSALAWWTATVGQAERFVIGFVDHLRQGGLRISTASAIDFEQALDLVGLGNRRVVLETGLVTLVKRGDDVPRYLELAASYLGITAPNASKVVLPTVVALDDSDDGTDDDETERRAERVVRYSAIERLRSADLGALGAAEREEAMEALAALRLAPPLRRSARRSSAPRGQLDARATLRASFATDLEPVERRYRAATRVPRPVVFLLDVSGSMQPYAVAMLRLAWVFAAVAKVEAWALGTRATRISRALGRRDPDVAVAEAVTLVADWGGGTRLGAGIDAFVHGVRRSLRSAVVVVCSDGWDRGDPEQMRAAMASLRRRSAAIVWVNPLAGLEGYAPLARGMAAALGYVDALIAGESVASLERAAARIVEEAGRA